LHPPILGGTAGPCEPSDCTRRATCSLLARRDPSDAFEASSTSPVGSGMPDGKASGGSLSLSVLPLLRSFSPLMPPLTCRAQTPTMPNMIVLIALCLTPSAAWHTTAAPYSRSTVRKVSMVAWQSAPADLAWAKMAWDALGLHAGSMDAAMGCVLIPATLTPDQSRQWYFCSTAATNEHGADMQCSELPMMTAGRTVHICTTNYGSRPSYYE